MWSKKFYHSFTQLSTEGIGGNCEDKEKITTFREVEPFWCSSSQTRRPTNWATPGYEIMRKCSLWSNMWSTEFYHIFRKLSTEVITGFYGVTREYATFREVEPIWCSSSQTRRPTNWATPGSLYSIISAFLKKSNPEITEKAGCHVLRQPAGLCMGSVLAG